MSLSVFFQNHKKRCFISPKLTLMTFLLGFASSTAWGQVTTNNDALNQLGSAPKTNTTAQKKSKIDKKKKTTPAKPNHIRQKTTPATPGNTAQKSNPVAVTPTTQHGTPTSTQKPIEATIPKGPPPVPVFSEPGITVPLHPPSPPPMPIINAKAAGRVVKTTSMTTLIFAPDGDDLNELMMQAVMDVADNLKRHPDTQIYLNAYSHAVKDDPSTPRRLSLNRGLTIRAVLINQGIPTTRIYLLTKGAASDEPTNTNPDRVDLIRSDQMIHPKAESNSKPVK